MKPRPNSFHEKHIMFFRRSQERAQLGGVRCNRFFTKYILAGFDSVKGVDIVVGVRGSCRRGLSKFFVDQNLQMPLTDINSVNILH